MFVPRLITFSFSLNRDPDKTPEVVPYNQEIRKEMDKMIDHVNQKILIKRGYDPMPLHLYSYYQKVCTKNIY